MVTKNITPKSTIKSWFKRGLKPLEVQFHAWMDSYWHKEEKIPTSTIDGLEEILNNKAESSGVDNLIGDLDTHKSDDVRHKTNEEQQKLNNLADDPNLTYATKEELEAQGAIIIPFDFTKPDTESDAEIKAYLQPFIEDGTFFTKPVFAHYMWKSSYDPNATDVTGCSFIVPSEPYYVATGRGGQGYSFNYPIDVLTVDYPDEPYKCKITVYLLKGSDQVRITMSDYEPESDRTIFLSENGDGSILSIDGSAAWNFFKYSLDQGLRPAIYLKSNNTDIYIPAAYDFNFRTTPYIGNIRIQYLKEVDGKRQLWIENRNFSEASGGFVGSGSSYEVPEGGIITKIPLDGWTEMYVLKCIVAGDQSVTATNPEIMEAYVAAHAAGKSPLLVLSLMDFIYKYPTQMATQENMIVVYFASHSITSFADDRKDLLAAEYKVTATKTNSSWTVQVSYVSTTLTPSDYIKVSDIQVVTEYPADLSAYPDGSIFIKQEAVS